MPTNSNSSWGSRRFHNAAWDARRFRQMEEDGVRHRPRPGYRYGCGPDCPACLRDARERAGVPNSVESERIGTTTGGQQVWEREYLGIPVPSLEQNLEEGRPAPRYTGADLPWAVEPVPSVRTTNSINIDDVYRRVYNDNAMERMRLPYSWTDEARNFTFDTGVIFIRGEWADFIKLWAQVGEVHEARAYMKPVDESKYVKIQKVAKDFRKKMGAKPKRKDAYQTAFDAEIRRLSDMMATPRVYVNEPPREVSGRYFATAMPLQSPGFNGVFSQAI